MEIDHERLDICDLSLEFLVSANGIIEGLPRGRSHLSEQFTRPCCRSHSIWRRAPASTRSSISVGTTWRLSRAKTDDTRGSATESAALLDVCQRLMLLDEAGHRAAKGMLVRIVSMLIKLAQSGGS